MSKPVIEARLLEVIGRVLGADASPGGARARHTIGAAGFSRTARILLAEDNLVNRKVFLAMLRRLGAVAYPVPNGAEAVRALQSGEYDLVLMDCEMPVMDGYEAVKLVRDSATGVRNPGVPVIAVTASAMPGDREKCLQAGMDDYLSKPIDAAELAAVLAKWLPTGAPAGTATT